MLRKCSRNVRLVVKTQISTWCQMEISKNSANHFYQHRGEMIAIELIQSEKKIKLDFSLTLLTKAFFIYFLKMYAKERNFGSQFSFSIGVIPAMYPLHMK